MMADRLKGITIEIGAETSGLTDALKDVNNESRKISTELSDVQRLLKFNPDNAELLAQRQTLLNRQIETTSEKLNQLKRAESQVQAQFERGDIGEQAFRAFQREIIATEGRLQHFERQAQGTARDVRGTLKGMGGGIANAIAGAAAGAGIGTIVEKALETTSLQTKIKVGFDVPDDALGKVKEIITGIQAYGIEGETALEGVRKQFALNGDQSVATNEKIIKSAAIIARSYADIDFNELIQESNEFGEAIGISQQQALEMTNALLKAGFPPDQLDIMSEYGSQLKRAGYNAQEIQGIFRAGVETKSWNIDVLLDGVKEGRIRLAEFGQGVDKTTATMIKGTGISADKLKEWGAAVAEGGQTGKIAFGEVATQLGKVENESQRNAIGSRLFGTLWEEQGKKVTDALAGANTKTGNLKKNTQDLVNIQKQVDADPQVQLNKALGDMMITLAPLLTKVSEFIGKIAEWVQKNPEIAAGITAATVVLGILIGVAMAFIPVLGGLATAAGALNIAMLPLTGIILGVIAVVLAVIAIGVLLYKNWDTIVAKAKKDFAELLSIIVGVGKRIAKSWNDAINDFKKAWASVSKTLGEVGRRIVKQWDDAVQDLKDGLNGFKKWVGNINLRDIGSKIIKGLVNGMQDMYEKVKGKARDIAATVKQAIKDKLKLKSPSKVTTEMGQNVGLGMVEGMQNSMNKIKNMSNRMANAAIPNTTTSNSSISNNKSMTVNINSPKALDVREANKQFNRTLNKMSLDW